LCPKRLSCGLALKVRSGLTKYRSLLVVKYRQIYRESCACLRWQVYRKLDHELYRKLHGKLLAELSRSLLSKPHETLIRRFFASLFAAMFGSLFEKLRASSRLPTHRQRPRGRRPVGRGVDGRIVVGFWPTTTYRWRCVL